MGKGIWRTGIALGAFLPLVAAACSSGLCMPDTDWESRMLSARTGIRLDVRYDRLDRQPLWPGMGGTVSFAFPGRREIEQGAATRRMTIGTKEIFRSGTSFNLNLDTRYFFNPAVLPRPPAGAPYCAPGDPDAGGGKALYLSPGITMNLEPAWKILSFIQLPVYQQANSLQAPPRWIFSLGTNYSF